QRGQDITKDARRRSEGERRCAGCPIEGPREAKYASPSSMGHGSLTGSPRYPPLARVEKRRSASLVQLSARARGGQREENQEQATLRSNDRRCFQSGATPLLRSRRVGWCAMRLTPP